MILVIFEMDQQNEDDDEIEEIDDKETSLRVTSKKKDYLRSFFYRDEWIRTIDHLNPIQVLYQTELHPVLISDKFSFSF